MGEELENTENPVTAEEEAAELTIDDLFNEQVNEEAVNKAQSEMLLPVGTYTTIPQFKITKMGRDKNNRPFARFYGECEFGQHKGRIGFGLSWERRNARVKDEVSGELVEDPSKPDRAYKNYVMAVKAYKAAHGEAPSNVGAVLEYLQNYPVKLRLIQTQDGENMVVAISAVRG